MVGAVEGRSTIVRGRGWGGGTGLLRVEHHGMHRHRPHVDALIRGGLALLGPEQRKPSLDGVLAILGELRPLDGAR